MQLDLFLQKLKWDNTNTILLLRRMEVGQYNTILLYLQTYWGENIAYLGKCVNKDTRFFAFR